MKKTILLAVVTMCLVSCNSQKENEIVVGASPTPHAEILEVVKPIVEEKGYKLTIKVFDDYVTPNLSLQNGDIDANYFQHTPYLDDFNANNKTDLVGVCKVHFEPMGIYSTKHDKLESGLKIAIPNDTSNGKRARDLLTANNITGTIIELEAQTLPAVLTDVDYACINGNYALSSGVVDKCIVTESNESDIAKTNANIIAVKNGNQESAKTKVLVESIQTQKVKEFIKTKYGSTVICMF